MKTMKALLNIQSAKYQIKIKGRQAKGWSDWMDDLDISTELDSEGVTLTTLTGVVKDQSCLHGLLNHIRDLGIPLISVQLIHSTRINKERDDE